MLEPSNRLYMRIFICFSLALSYCENIKAAEVPEEQLKAAYLIHLSEFTTWPTEKMQPPSFTICIASDSLLRGSLEQIRNHHVKDKPLNIEYNVSIENINTCHVLYVESKSNKKVFQQALQKKLGILTVSSDALFAKEGGIIEYYSENKKIRMRVNLNALNQAGLTMSYKVLRLMESNF